jgi:hypothetical protein
MLKRVLVWFFFISICGLLFARQDEEKEQLKRTIMEKVKARLKMESKALLLRIKRILDREIGVEKTKYKKKMERYQEKLIEIEKEIKELEKEGASKKKIARYKRRALKYKRKIIELKWWDKDIDLVKKAQKEGPEDLEEAREMFDDALSDHENAEYDKSIKAFKMIFYKFPEEQIGCISAYNVACGYSLKKLKEEAIDWLEISIARGFLQLPPSRGHQSMLEHIEDDSDLDNIRDEKRYKELIKWAKSR